MMWEGSKRLAEHYHRLYAIENQSGVSYINGSLMPRALLCSQPPCLPLPPSLLLLTPHYPQVPLVKMPHNSAVQIRVAQAISICTVYTSSRASSLSDLSTSVTFLATLFLLLFLSCAIILRSFILRRRYQRRLEEAMAAGLVLTPRTPGSRQTRFGVKPKIFDSWFINGDEKWAEVQVSSFLDDIYVRFY